MISVIVPVYNSAPYLKNCISSILQQTYADLEIICVNDGSSDDSLSILEELAKQDCRIRVISQANAGVSAARNTGLDAAQGEYITFVDSDDELAPDMYEFLVNLACEYNAEISHCGYRKVHVDGTSKDICGTGELLVQGGDEAVCCLLNGEHFVPSLCNKLFRRETVLGLRLDSSLKINEDVLFNVQAFHRAEKAVFMDLPKYLYYERETSSCATTASIRKKQDSVKAAEEVLELMCGTEAETAAAGRLYYCLLDLYRAYLFEGIRSNQTRCDELHQKICKVERLKQPGSDRSKLNYQFMRKFPVAYKAVYGVYDRIRKPNWDL